MGFFLCGAELVQDFLSGSIKKNELLRCGCCPLYGMNTSVVNRLAVSDELPEAENDIYIVLELLLHQILVIHLNAGCLSRLSLGYALFDGISLKFTIALAISSAAETPMISGIS